MKVYAKGAICAKNKKHLIFSILYDTMIKRNGNTMPTYRGYDG